jgi:hypothetical protein
MSFQFRVISNEFFKNEATPHHDPRAGGRELTYRPHPWKFRDSLAFYS